MAWAAVQNQNANNNGTASASVTTSAFASAVAANDLLVLFMGTGNTLVTSNTITDNITGNTYNLIGSLNQSSNGKIFMYYCVVTNGGSAMTFTCTPNTSSDIGFTVLHYTGNATASPIDQHSIISANGLTSPLDPAAGTMAVNNANELIVAGIFSTNSVNPVTHGTGWTERSNVTWNTATEVLEIQDQFPISAAIQASWTLTTGSRVLMAMAGFNIASGGGGGAVVTPAAAMFLMPDWL